MQIESSLITGTCTLLAVAVTLFFTSKREKGRFLQDLRSQEFIRLEAFYVDLVSAIDLSIRYIKNEEDYRKFLEEQSRVSAKANLIAPKNINKKLAIVSNSLYEWSSLYRQSLPKKLEDTGLRIVSNENFEFKEKAEKAFPKLQHEIGDFIELIREELDTQRKNIIN